LTLVQTDVLVAPKRVVKRFAGLTHDEVTDLFVSAQKVLSAIEREYNATSCTLAIQDGQDAGQTVEHVHLHIVPRRPGDFQRNDDVYDKIHDSETSLDVPHQAMRGEQDMKKESSRLSALLNCL
jgi:bis(5'-adenosyl)-triphosphatase